MVVVGMMKKKKNGNLKTQLMNGKKENLITIKSRLNGWQLDSFNESYQYKISNGISLFKKRLMKD